EPEQCRREKARRDRQQPRIRGVADLPAHIGAQEIERAMRQVHVAHEPEYQGESARDQKVERREGDAIQEGRDELACVVDERPDNEDRDRSADQDHRGPELEALSSHAAGRLQRVREARSSGSLWNTPSFMIASSLLRSARIERSASGSPSTSRMSARKPSFS